MMAEKIATESRYMYNMLYPFNVAVYIVGKRLKEDKAYWGS